MALIRSVDARFCHYAVWNKNDTSRIVAGCPRTILTTKVGSSSYISSYISVKLN